MAHVFGPEGSTEKFLPIVESMVSDPMFYVRKEAAAAVGSLSAAVTPETTLEKLVSIHTYTCIICILFFNLLFFTL